MTDYLSHRTKKLRSKQNLALEPGIKGNLFLQYRILNFTREIIFCEFIQCPTLFAGNEDDLHLSKSIDLVYQLDLSKPICGYAYRPSNHSILLSATIFWSHGENPKKASRHLRNSSLDSLYILSAIKSKALPGLAGRASEIINIFFGCPSSTCCL